MPVASCSLAEPELVEIGAEAAAGHLSSSVYFESIDTPANRAFVQAYRGRFPDAGPTSADAEASYLAVHLLARAVRRAGTAEMTAVRAALPHVGVDAPQGQVRIDRDNRHCYLTPRIGVSTDRVRLRRDLRGAGTREAGPLPRLAGGAGRSRARSAGRTFAWWAGS